MSEKNIPHVVCGVDGSADGLRAVAYAVRVAKALDNATLELVHAVDDAVLAGAWGAVYEPNSLEQVGKAVNAEALELVESMDFPSDRVRADVVMGNPSIVLARRSEDADLLVVGRRAVGGLERMFVGSTSVTLAATAHCPLIVISAASNPDPTGQLGVIAVAVDNSKHSEKTIRFALDEARRRNAKLIVRNVQSIVPQGMFGGYRLTEGAQAEVVEQGRVQLEQRMGAFAGDYPDVEVSIDVTSGHAVDELIATTEHVDLLVMGMRAPSIIGFSIGGITRAVMAHAKSPLCVVR